MPRHPAKPDSRRAQKTDAGLKLYLVPCSCGTTFAVSENYDLQGTAWGRYLRAPECGKRHDPTNRILQLGFQRDGYWKVDECLKLLTASS